MNIMNVFWAMFAFIAGLLVTILIWMVMIPLANAMVTTGSGQYYVTYAGAWMLTIVFLIIIPITTAMADEEGGGFKKLITRG